MAGELLDKTSAMLAKVLDGAALRQRVLANNIANVDTPGYTRQDVNFESQVRDLMDRPTIDPKREIAAIQSVAIEEQNDTQTPRRADGNNVVIDHEMVSMARNSLQYESAARLLTMKLRAVRSAITAGRG